MSGRLLLYFTLDTKSALLQKVKHHKKGLIIQQWKIMFAILYKVKSASGQVNVAK